MHKKNTILSIVEASKDLVSNFDNLLKYLSTLEDSDKKAFDINKSFPSISGSTSSIYSRAMVVQGIIEGFGESRDYDLIPVSRLFDLKLAINQVITKTTELHKYLEKTLKRHGGYLNINYTNFKVLAKDGSSHEMQQYFIRLDEAVEKLLDAFYSSVIILKPDETQVSFQTATNGLQYMLQDIHKELVEVRHDGEDLKRVYKSALLSVEKISSAEQRFGEIEEQSSSLVEKIQLAEDDSKKSIQEIENTKDDAVKLELLVQNYRASFSEYQFSLDERNLEIEKAGKKLAKLTNDLENKRTQIAENISRSEEMLTGATVAGLASNFKTIEDKLTSELSSAKNSFYFGAVCLFVSALPLVFSVFIPVIAPFFINDYPNIVDVIKETGINSNSTGWQYVGQVMARLVIIMPAVWLMSFAAIRYSSLFRLREHYSYKYSMAVSVEGFKKEAQGYESEIAAMVLEQLAFNPADKLLPLKSMNEGQVPNPLMQFLMKKIRSKVNEAPQNNPE